jgi:GNAT superfamily N-acetyltransferase
MKYIVLNSKKKIEFRTFGDCPPFYHCKDEVWQTKGKIGFIRYIINEDKRPESLKDILTDRNIELRQIFVDGRYRGKGCGTILLNELIKIAKKKGFKEIWLSSFTDKHEVFYKFLISSGFEKKEVGKWIKNI